MNRAIRILLVDDQPLMRHAAASLLAVEPEFSICGEAGTIAQALRLLHRTQPDVVLADLRLGREDGLDLLRRIHAEQPSLPVLILSLHKEALFAESALRAGAAGYLMKSDAPQELAHAVREVTGGRVYASEPIRQTLFSRLRHVGSHRPAVKPPLAAPGPDGQTRSPARSARTRRPSRCAASGAPG